MFRKQWHKSSQHPMKGSERRRLVSDIEARFPLISSSQLDELFPKSCSVTDQRLPDRV